MSVLLKKKYYVNVLTIALTLFMDFVGYNSLALIAGTLGKVMLAAHTIVSSFYTNMMSFTDALYTVLSNQLSHHFSQGRLDKTITIIFSAVLLNSLFVFISVTSMLSFHQYIFKLFTSDP